MKLIKGVEKEPIPSMDFQPISSENRAQVNRFIQAHWFSTDMVIRGEVVDMTRVEGFLLFDHAEIIGLVTYRIQNEECEILSLDSLMENQGHGSALIVRVIHAAAAAGCQCVRLITTNDNINALRFYQKRGFDMTRLFHNSIEVSRRIKPSIPETGDFGIPIRHEIEFVMNLQRK